MPRKVLESVGVVQIRQGQAMTDQLASDIVQTYNDNQKIVGNVGAILLGVSTSSDSYHVLSHFVCSTNAGQEADL